jgi:hypothetical protein
MRGLTRRVLVILALLIAVPSTARAQSSNIGGSVKDATGALLRDVTVEASSPALIEKTRTAITDASGQYKIIGLRPGTYTISFTLPGFGVVKREGIELTSDFTATVNAEMKVAQLEETVTVPAESPVVDVQNITVRTVMTREVLDTIPTGRNIQAVGILIPGTALSPGGGGALSRDVGGSGGLQQSPLQYRGSADAVQTIEGLRLNNLCANGAYSGVYWNDQSFQEISYVTGADSTEMGQGGIRVNMVPKDGGNSFHGVVFGNYAPSSWASDNCGSAGFLNGAALPCTRSEVFGDLTFNANNKLTNVSKITRIWDFNPGVGGPIKQDRVWFYASFRSWGVNKTVAGSFFNASSNRFKYVPDLTRPGIDDGHIRSIAGRVTARLGANDKVSYYHDEQDKVRGHLGISAMVPPEASAIQATPRSFVSVTKWTRTHTSKLMLEGGLGVYDQEVQTNYQPSVFATNPPLVTLHDDSTGIFANAWSSPGDSFSKLFTEQFAASYVTGAHLFRFGTTVSQGRWRLAQRYTLDIAQVNYSGLTAAGTLNPVSVQLAVPTDRRNAIKNDSAVFAQDKWTLNRMTITAGLRWDWFIGETLPETLPAGTFNPAVSFPACSDGKNNLAAGCTGTVQNWKDLNPRIGVSYDLFGNGKTAVKASFARYVNGVGLAAGSITDNNNPEASIGLTDPRAWNDLDGDGSPLDAAGNIQFNELSASTNTNFGKVVPTTLVIDPAVLSGWGVRGYSREYAFAIQHELAPRIYVHFGFGRRVYLNQTVTVDNRYNFANNSYDGPFCANAPPDPNLPGGGNYQVCGLYDLTPAAFARPATTSTVAFSSNYGGVTNNSEGFDFTTVARFKGGAFLQGGLTMGKRIFDQCNLVKAGIKAAVYDAATEVAEVFSDGTKACHQDLPYRPDFKLMGSYPLPFDVQLSATYQFTRGIQNGLGAPSLQATWTTTPASATTLGLAYSGGLPTKTVNLIAVGANYGNFNLKQLDLRASKRFKFSGYRFRMDFDAYNIFNSNWPFTVNSTFSSAASSAWLRPTNVLQSRFFKIGAQFDF